MICVNKELKDNVIYNEEYEVDSTNLDSELFIGLNAWEKDAIR